MTLNKQIGQKVIIRTYSAGVWFGVLAEKEKEEVLLKDARRLWRWQTNKSISLSGVALYGVKQAESKICAPVSQVWLQAIEIITPSDIAIKSIESCPEVEAV